MPQDTEEYETLRLRLLSDKAYQEALSKAWDCNDPSHPGCKSCEAELFKVKSSDAYSDNST